MKRFLLLILLSVASLCSARAAGTLLGNTTISTGSAFTVSGTATAKAPAWTLSTYAGNATISPSQYGIGWADSRFTVQTPVGALQFYYAGSPAEPVIYWPGRIVTTNFEAVSIVGTVSASLLSGGTIASDIMAPSLPSPMQEWQMGESYARLNGLTYVTDTDLGINQLEPTIGVWFPQVNVVNGSSLSLNYGLGRWRTAAQFAADLSVPRVVAAPATATSAGTAGQIAYDSSFFYVCIATNTWKRAALATW